MIIILYTPTQPSNAEINGGCQDKQEFWGESDWKNKINIKGAAIQVKKALGVSSLSVFRNSHRSGPPFFNIMLITKLLCFRKWRQITSPRKLFEILSPGIDPRRLPSRYSVSTVSYKSKLLCHAEIFFFLRNITHLPIIPPISFSYSAIQSIHFFWFLCFTSHIPYYCFYIKTRFRVYREKKEKTSFPHLCQEG